MRLKSIYQVATSFHKDTFFQSNRFQNTPVNASFHHFYVDYCPAHPAFQRMESDIGYFIETDTTRTYQEAVDYCRTNFESPTYFPDLKTLESFTETISAVHFKGNHT